MTSAAGIRIRTAGVHDAGAVAALHAESWRRHYRGAYADAFLDGDVHADRHEAWGERLRRPPPDARTFVAEAGGAVVGFAHVALDGDPDWGALLDNLHVAHARARTGIGTRLLVASADAVAEHRPGVPLYLWVLEQNVAAQAFYAAMGGRCVRSEPVGPPGGDPGRLAGSPRKLRFVWTDVTRCGRR